MEGGGEEEIKNITCTSWLEQLVVSFNELTNTRENQESYI